jgi:NAD(P)-dependent dehydrogenase (short-subunit alcohol dehydrogenase family)
MQSVLQPILGPKKTVEDLSGRVAIITGGAFGIGYEISRTFVLNGARVIMVNRKEDQGQEAIDKIKEEAGSDAKIEWVPCDMGNLAQIREVASRFVEEERLDLVSRDSVPAYPISRHQRASVWRNTRQNRSALPSKLARAVLPDESVVAAAPQDLEDARHACASSGL